MNNKTEIEDFLNKLPKETAEKIKKLKFAQNLVLIQKQHNTLKSVETNELIKKTDWNYTLPGIAQKLHVSRSWLYNNLQGRVRYIYLNNFDLQGLSIFYEKSIAELRQYRPLTPIHLCTQDVVEWFNSSFVHGKRSVVINAQNIFGEDASKILLDYALNGLNHLRLNMNDLDKYVLDKELWGLCCKAPRLYKTSKYPIVVIPKSLTVAEFDKINFRSLGEYTYSANGMRDILTSGADIYKNKKGKNSKMLFTFPDNSEPFDTQWMYQELSKRLKDSSYSPKVIDDTVTTLVNMFVVPAVQYFKEFSIS